MQQPAPPDSAPAAALRALWAAVAGGPATNGLNAAAIADAAAGSSGKVLESPHGPAAGPAQQQPQQPVRKKPGRKPQIPRCQVPGCGLELTDLKACGRIHSIDEFEGDRRSCRRKLKRHNERRSAKKAARRKRKADDSDCSTSPEPSQGTLPSSPSGGGQARAKGTHQSARAQSAEQALPAAPSPHDAGAATSGGCQAQEPDAELASKRQRSGEHGEQPSSSVDQIAVKQEAAPVPVRPAPAKAAAAHGGVRSAPVADLDACQPVSPTALRPGGAALRAIRPRPAGSAWQQPASLPQPPGAGGRLDAPTVASLLSLLEQLQDQEAHHRQLQQRTAEQIALVKSALADGGWEQPLPAPPPAGPAPDDGSSPDLLQSLEALLMQQQQQQQQGLPSNYALPRLGAGLPRGAPGMQVGAIALDQLLLQAPPPPRPQVLVPTLALGSGPASMFHVPGGSASGGLAGTGGDAAAALAGLLPPGALGGAPPGVAAGEVAAALAALLAGGAPGAPLPGMR
eukprot:scaffold5.g934.t1